MSLCCVAISILSLSQQLELKQDLLGSMLFVANMEHAKKYAVFVKLDPHSILPCFKQFPLN